MSNKCKHCGEKFTRKGQARCPKCKQWQTGIVHNEHGDGSTLLVNVKPAGVDRLQTGPWDICWGESYSDKRRGIVRGSTTLIGGSPGAGKSTLLLQISDGVVQETNEETLYIAVEEPEEQVKERADRLGIIHQGKIRITQLLSGEGAIPDLLAAHKPKLIVLDSISALANGSESTAIEVCKVLKGYCMQYRAAGLIVSHIIKDGDLAGVMALQHEVDTTMTFFPEGEPGKNIEPPRTLEVMKNRNGAITSMTMLMTECGLIAIEEEDEEDEEDEGEEGA